MSNPVSSSDFILDEGLDEEEDVFALHTATSESKTCPAADLPGQISPATPKGPDHLERRAVIIDGLSLNTSRADVNQLAENASIECLRLRRVEEHKILRVYVKFTNEKDTELILSKDGSYFNDSFISVKPASNERWNATMSTPSKAASSVWSAWVSAKAVAEKLEQNAKHLGDSLEKKLQVSEKMTQIDKSFHVRDKLEHVAKTTKETTSAVDDKLGLSRGVSTILEGAGLVAKEVDENWRVGETAREMANSAFRSPIAGMLGKMMSSENESHPLAAGGSRVMVHPPSDISQSRNSAAPNSDGDHEAKD